MIATIASGSSTARRHAPARRCCAPQIHGPVRPAWRDTAAQSVQQADAPTRPPDLTLNTTSPGVRPDRSVAGTRRSRRDRAAECPPPPAASARG